jgi:predicted transcriptional regulator of viral defense system
MKSKNISTRSGTLLQHFLQRDRDHFLYQEAFEALPGSQPGAVRQLLSDMTKRGLLMRPMEGKYWIIPYDRDPDTYMPDWPVMASFLASGKPNYCGYYSALQLHNLTTQPSHRQQLVVARQMTPSQFQVQGATFQFIYHNPNHYFGSEPIWVSGYHKVECSDLEKTFVDCLFQPQYAFGISEVSKALFFARNKLNFERLLEYVKRFGSQAVIKRLGFLLDLLEIRTPIVDQLFAIKTKSFVLLDPVMPAEGRMVSRWNVRVNTDTETLVSGIYS